MATDIAMSPRFIDVAVDALRPSLTNPRKHFTAEALSNLAASMKVHGLAQPILIRPIASELPSDPGFEIVAGERRWRAAKAIDWLTIPAIMRDLTDLQTLELQVIENLQRVDLHPLEEAEGYERLQVDHGYSVDDLAAKVGKSASYVYQRIKLLWLVPEARTAFYDGKLSAGTAILVARMTPAVQEAAIKEVTSGDDGHPLPIRQAAELFRRRFMLDLRVAVFDTEDPQLFPPAGPCTTCPKRTGNQHQLFADVSNADTCTDPSCFDGKRTAHWKLERARLEKQGRTIIEGEAAQKIVRPWGAIDGYETVADVVRHVERETGLEPDVAAKTVRDIIRSSKVRPVAIEMPAGGYTDSLDEEQQSRIEGELQKLFDIKSAAKKPVQTEAEKERVRALEAARRRRHVVADYESELARKVIGAADVEAPTTIQALRIMLFAWWRTWNDNAQFDRRGEVFSSRGLAFSSKDFDGQVSTMREWVQQADGDALSRLMLQVTVFDDVDEYREDDEPSSPIVHELAALYVIDAATLRRTMVDDVLEPPPVKKRAVAAVKYLHPDTGETWSGRGKRPRWLEGKEISEFAVGREAAREGDA